MNRYDLITNYRCGSSIEEMERSDDGEWVRVEDVQKQLEQLPTKTTVTLVDEFERWAKTWDGDDRLVRLSDVLASLRGAK